MTTITNHKTLSTVNFLICTALLLVSFMAFGKRPMSWYYHSLVDTPAIDGHYTAVFVGDDFDPTAETLVLQKPQQQPNKQYLRAAHQQQQRRQKLLHGVGPAEEIMDLNLLFGQ